MVCLLRWREENSSLLLECEVDALRRDSHGCTPLAWACMQGHRDAALLLYRWNCQAVQSTDHQGHTPLQCARLKGMVFYLISQYQYFHILWSE